MGLNGWQRRQPKAVDRPPSGPEGKTSTDTGYASDPGPRATNQDRAAVSANWAVISDGAGGHAGGDAAAELAVQAVTSRLGRSAGLYDVAAVIEALSEANAAGRSRRRTDADLADMAATLSIAACTSSRPGSRRWVIANLGDSPVWQSSGGRLEACVMQLELPT
jgi:PPM family protein phosphatase